MLQLRAAPSHASMPQHRHAHPFKWTAAEDVTVAMWLVAFDVRHVDTQRFNSFARPCCFEGAAQRSEVAAGVAGGGAEAAGAAGALPGLRMLPSVEARLCGDGAFLVLHKLEPVQLRHVGERARACAAAGAGGDAAIETAPAASPVPVAD